MVKLLRSFFITVAVVVALGCSSINSDQIQKSLDFKTIYIAHNGSHSGYISSNESAEDCKTFILNKPEIIAFFKHSRIATSREYAHDLISSNCYVSGNFTASNGIEGTWKIDRSRRGFISYNHGENTKYFYCAECNNALFYEACDIECIHDP